MNSQKSLELISKQAIFSADNIVRPAVRTLVLPLSLVFLSGCVPTGFTIASYAVDGISYAGSGKSLTDHMLSDWKGRDCATWRILKSRPICKDFTPEEIARRKRNRDSIRHDIGHAYIATNLDGIDLNDGTVLATTTKTNARANVKARPASPAIEHKPAASKANDGPVRLQPAPVKRQDLPAAGAGDRRPIAKRPEQPVALRQARAARRIAADSRYLVFGSFRHRGEAKRFAGRHKVMRPTILPVRVRGKRYYRVVVRADGREALASARHQLRRNGVKDAYTMRICPPGSAASRRSAHCM
jgi:hypothetical protein